MRVRANCGLSLTGDGSRFPAGCALCGACVCCTHCLVTFADGLGYADDGEEEFSDASDDETRNARKRARAEDNDTRHKKKGSGAAFAQSTKITSLFLKPSATVLAPPTADSKASSATDGGTAPAPAPAASDDFLEGLLGELDKPTASVAPVRTIPARIGHVSGPRRALFEHSAPLSFNEVADVHGAGSSHEFEYGGGGYEYDGDAAMAGASASGAAAASGSGADASPSAPVEIGAGAERSKWRVTPKERVQMLTRPAAAAGSGGDVFSPEDLVMSLGNLDSGGLEPVGEAVNPKELGSLPLTPEGTLLMFWLDAYEDPVLMPGTLYLFGKVCWRGLLCAIAHVSCVTTWCLVLCAVVCCGFR